MVRVILAAPFVLMLVLFFLSRGVKSKMEGLLATKHKAFFESLKVDEKQKVPLHERLLEGDAAKFSVKIENRVVTYGQIFHDRELLQSLDDPDLMMLAQTFKSLWGLFKWSILPALMMLTILIIELSVD